MWKNCKWSCNVILDWGFWRGDNRRYVSKYFKNENITVEWHFIDIEDKEREENIRERNEKIEQGLNKYDFVVTDGVKKKVLDNWEKTDKDEIDVWYFFERE